MTSTVKGSEKVLTHQLDYLNNEDTPQKNIGGAALVSTETPGLARSRFISVETATLPVAATSGVATWYSPGVKSIVIMGVAYVSGTLPTAAGGNFLVRYAVDSPNDGTSALLLPTTINTSSATADIGQVGGFNLTPVWNGTSIFFTMSPVFIDVSDPILRLDLAHNIGTSLVLQFLIQAVEVV